MVMKNSLAKIALKNTNFLGAQDLFFGPVVIAFSNEPVSTSKLLIKICSAGSKLDVIGGMVLDKLLDKEEVISLSKMPSKDEVRTKIVGLINAAASNILRVLNEPKLKLCGVFKTYAEKQ
jgi:large subunit ribosomal protein L10